MRWMRRRDGVPWRGDCDAVVIALWHLDPQHLPFNHPPRPRNVGHARVSVRHRCDLPGR